jgi:hypothetical protein
MTTKTNPARPAHSNGPIIVDRVRTNDTVQSSPATTAATTPSQYSNAVNQMPLSKPIGGNPQRKIE